MADPATSLLVALGIEPFAFVAALGLALAVTALVAVVSGAPRRTGADGRR